MLFRKVLRRMKKDGQRYADAGHKMAKAFKICCIVLFILYVLLLLYLTMYSRYYGRGYIRRSMNLVPFETIMRYLNANINRNIIVTNLLGNIAAFMPMGFFLPLVSKRLSGLIRTAAACAGASLLIEIAQYITGVGAADIDDIILNSLGGILGYFIFLICRGLYKLAVRKK
jgi:glycopeptide antibiotics resistance protein